MQSARFLLYIEFSGEKGLGVFPLPLEKIQLKGNVVEWITSTSQVPS